MAPASDTVDRSDYVPMFSKDERDRRWSLVRERMRQRGVDALVIWGTDRSWGMARANLRYLTQIAGQVDAVGLFPLSGEPVVWSEIPHMQEPYNVWPAYQDWVTDSRLFRGMGPVVDEIEERGLDEGKIGIVGFASMLSQFNVPYDQFAALEEGLAETEIIDCTDLVEQVRLVKSDEEIEMLRKAGEIAHAMATALMEAEPGQKECEVYADMVYEQIARGGESYVFNLLDSGNPTDSNYEHLLHGKGQPLSPSHRTLADGDIVITEYHANWGGNLVAAEKSVALGNAPDELTDVHEVCLECQRAAEDVFTPGTRLEDVWEAIRAPAREAGMDFVELGFHGHGLGSPEFPAAVYPQEPNETYPDGVEWHLLSGRDLEDMRLREGMVFGTNIDVHDPNWRDDVGLQFGDTLVVTDGKPEPLIDTPTQFVV